MYYEIKNPEGPGRGWLRLLLATYLNQQVHLFFNEKELQMQLGFSTKTFRSLLEATGNPTLEMVEHIARMLNVPVWRLFFILDKTFEKEINGASLCFDILSCDLYGENDKPEINVPRNGCSKRNSKIKTGKSVKEASKRAVKLTSSPSEAILIKAIWEAVSELTDSFGLNDLPRLLPDFEGTHPNMFSYCAAVLEKMGLIKRVAPHQWRAIEKLACDQEKPVDNATTSI